MARFKWENGVLVNVYDVVRTPGQQIVADWIGNWYPQISHPTAWYDDLASKIDEALEGRSK